MTMPNDHVFAGVKVLDVASFIAGPGAATVLSDFGADVIKVEPPGAGDLQRILASLGYLGDRHARARRARRRGFLRAP